MRAAAAAVAARAPGVEQSGIISEVGSDLAEHVNALQSHQLFQDFVAEGGWSVKLVDLTRVCGFQLLVHIDHAEDRAAVAVIGDMPSIAEVTLPIGKTVEKPEAYFDAGAGAWIVASRNPNFRILQQIEALAQSQDGRTVSMYGFIVAPSLSFVQVIKYRGRYMLRDGYHRSVGLLARGVTTAPVLYKEYGDFADLGVGMTVEPASRERPPLLPDYLNDEVSVLFQHPASQRMIVISGMQLTPLG